MYSIVFIFTIYSFIGWFFEVILKSVRDKKFVNSGFLYGPFCPIYGFGAIFILLANEAMGMIQMTWTAKVLISIVVATVIEYLAAVFLEKIFGTSWWDYSKEPFNIHGRVCLRFSMLWGVFGYLLLTYIHPSVMTGLQQIQVEHPFYMMIIITYFGLDFVVTLQGLLNVDRYQVLNRLEMAFPKLNRKNLKGIYELFKKKIL